MKGAWVGIGILLIVLSVLFGGLGGVVCILAGLLVGVVLLIVGLVTPDEKDAGKKKADRYCPGCGRAIPFATRICPYCGKKFEDNLQSNEYVYSEESIEVSEKNQEK